MRRINASPKEEPVLVLREPRYSQSLERGLGPHLISTADRISARLGYRRDDEMLGGG